MNARTARLFRKAHVAGKKVRRLYSEQPHWRKREIREHLAVQAAILRRAVVSAP